MTRDFPPRSNGGISSAVGGLVRASREAGVTCGVVSFDAWRPRTRGRGPATAERLDRGGAERAQPPSDRTVARVRSQDDLPDASAFARAFAPDVAVVHHAMLWPASSELVAGAPRVFSVHVVQSILRRLRGLDAPTKSEAAQAQALAEASLVVVPSHATRRELSELVSPSRVRVAPLGIDPPLPVTTAGAERDAVLYVGRLADVKGTAELLTAIDLVLERVPSARFVIAGGLPDSPRGARRWRERFRASASPPAIERTTFAGWLDRPHLERAYAAARLLVAPSWHETFGLAVVEAMARGVPVVATDAGALPERVKDGESGLLVPPRDPASLAGAIAELLDDPDTAAAMGAAARRAAGGWRWPAVIGAHVDAYRRARDSRTATPA